MLNNCSIEKNSPRKSALRLLRHSLFVAIASGVLIPAPLVAATQVYHFSVDLDAVESGSPAGSFTGSFSLNGDDLTDGFTTFAPNGMSGQGQVNVLETWQITIGNTNFNIANADELGLEIQFNGSAFYLMAGFVSYIDSPTDIETDFSIEPENPPNDFSVSYLVENQEGQTFSESNGSLTSVTLQETPAPVPLPSGLLLLASAVGAGAVVRQASRRKKAQ